MARTQWLDIVRTLALRWARNDATKGPPIMRRFRRDRGVAIRRIGWPWGTQAMIYTFEACELDLERYELRYAGKLVKIEPQVFNILAYLIRHRDRVVTKREFLEQLWAGRFVSEATLTSRLTAARRAIGDRGREQRVIQTVHGRGYRFIAAVTAQLESAGELHPVPGSIPAVEARPPALTPVKTAQPVGRRAELARLHHYLQQASDGTRQLVFVTGEAGLGKTTLLEAFLQELESYSPLRVARGQCIEHYGAGEAYLPLLEALGQLCKAPGGQEAVAILAKRAPTWVVQMPWLVTGDELEALQRRVVGATQERMLREMAEAVAVMAKDRPLILVLEDLHWSDYATLNLLARLARQQEPAHLLMLGTYRPTDVQQQGHPLQRVVQELKMHRRGDELALTLLTETAVAEYLTARFPGTILPAGLARLVHQRTEGNPLFMVNVVDAWEAEGWLEESVDTQGLRPGLDELAQGVPESLRQMLVQQLERLSAEEQQVLTAASVAGVEFSAAAVAAVLEIDVVEAESRCEGLGRRQQWLRSVGIDEWPDGTVAGRYAFIHALYHNVAYGCITAARLIQLHRRLGAGEEEAFGPRAREIAAELAVHFERGRDYRKAVQYLRHAAETAGQRYAHREAIQSLRRALELLKALPDGAQGLQQELELQLALGPALMVTRGFAAPEVAETYTRARQLCEQLSDRLQLFPVLFGLWRSSHVRGQLEAAYALGRQLVSLANGQNDPALLVEAHGPLGQTLCVQGKLPQARAHLQQVVTLYESARHNASAERFGYDPGVYAHAMAGWVLWLLGYPEQALAQSRKAVALAQEQAHPFTLAITLATDAILQFMRREGDLSLEQVEASLMLSTEYGFPYLRAVGTVLQGRALVKSQAGDRGVAQMRQGLVALRATGAELLRPYLLALLAESCAETGQIEAGLCALEEALVTANQHTERFFEAELYRLKGEFLLRLVMATSGTRCGQHAQNAQTLGGGWPDPLSQQMEAEACFLKALDIARHQEAKTLELRAALSLCRRWRPHGKRQEGRQLLAGIYGWFTEGFGTADLQHAKLLLEELA
jgi:DNA-binding winged helix-turn-helix (wHTH) protein/predicted ATPase